MNCTNHEEREAKGTCVYCGKFFCEECLVDISGKNYCKEHVAKVVEEKEHSGQQPNVVINNTNSNVNSNTNSSGYGIAVSPKSRLVSLLLCLFLGVIGIHRFYVGKIGTGILYIITFGFFGIGVFIDCLLIIFGAFRDSYGMPIKNW